MNISSIFKIFSLFVSVMLFLASSVKSAPAYSAEYDGSIRALVEMLLQRERDSQDDNVGYHTVSRKAGRSPQLRLRFGKRMDGQYPIPAAFINDAPDN